MWQSPDAVCFVMLAKARIEQAFDEAWIPLRGDDTMIECDSI